MNCLHMCRNRTTSPRFLELILYMPLVNSTFFLFLDLSMTLSALIDAKDFSAGGHRVGMSLEFEH